MPRLMPKQGAWQSDDEDERPPCRPQATASGKKIPAQEPLPTATSTGCVDKMEDPTTLGSRGHCYANWRSPFKTNARRVRCAPPLLSTPWGQRLYERSGVAEILKSPTIIGPNGSS